MRITRRQLRKLIAEHMIKPGIPNVPSSEAQGRIDDFARDPEMQADADSLAHSFGYPEDRSYSEDLQAYDDIAIPRKKEMALLGAEFARDEYTDDKGQYHTKHRICNDATKEASKILDSLPVSFVKPLIGVFIEEVHKREKVSLNSPFSMSRVTPEHVLVRMISNKSIKHYPDNYLLMYYPDYTLEGGYFVKKK